MSKQSALGSVGTWLAGIAAAVIATVIGYYLTRPTPTPPPPQAPTVTTFEGMVYSGSSPVPKAMVVVDLANANAPGPVHDITDDNGSYRIEFTGLPTTASATLSVSVNGFQVPAPTVLASPLGVDTHFDFPVTPFALTPVGSVGPGEPAEHGAVAPPPPHHPTANLPKPKYIPKLASQATKFTLPVKK